MEYFYRNELLIDLSSNRSFCEMEASSYCGCFGNGKFTGLASITNSRLLFIQRLDIVAVALFVPAIFRIISPATTTKL